MRQVERRVTCPPMTPPKPQQVEVNVRIRTSHVCDSPHLFPSELRQTAPQHSPVEPNSSSFLLSAGNGQLHRIRPVPQTIEFDDLTERAALVIDQLLERDLATVN